MAVEIAAQKKRNIILHCATNSQNSLRRFNGAMQKLAFHGIFGSPFELSPIPREEKIKYLCENEVQAMNQRKFSVDVNFWCREFESGKLDNVSQLEIPEQLFLLTKKQSYLDEQLLEIAFEKGVPVSINSNPYNFVELVSLLNTLVGSYGIGRYTSLEEISSGYKFPEVREMPAATVLIDAVRHLESAIFTSETLRTKLFIEQLWVREAVEGNWYSELKDASEQFILTLAKKLTGKIKYKLTSDRFQLISLFVDKPLYGKDRDQHEQDLLQLNIDKYDSLADFTNSNVVLKVKPELIAE